MITVAHRLYTIRNADQIVYLQDGKVIDSGTHDELMTRIDSYRDMMQAQQGEGVR